MERGIDRGTELLPILPEDIKFPGASGGRSGIHSFPGARKEAREEAGSQRTRPGRACFIILWPLLPPRVDVWEYMLSRRLATLLHILVPSSCPDNPRFTPGIVSGSPGSQAVRTAVFFLLN